jgi:putative Holliday junction resolvase
VARLLGIDPGTKRCGIAVSDSAQSMAFPRPALARDSTLIERLSALVDDEGIGAIIIGLPVALSGNETASTIDAQQLFEEVLERISDIPVLQCDERLTTVEAQKSLSEAGLRAKDQRSRVDSAAAVIMLQNYLDGLNAE